MRFIEISKEKIEEIKKHPYYTGVADTVVEHANKLITVDPPRIRYSDIHLYEATGNREKFQNIRSEYTTRMSSFFDAYVFTEDEKYLTPLADIIWNICDFETWAIPAHTSERASLTERLERLELCSTAVGAKMAEIVYTVGDKLPELVSRRAKAEIRRRIIDSYLKHKDAKFFPWMRKTDNWVAVCICNVLATFVYAAEKEELSPLIDEMVATARQYLKGIGDDGSCTEGYGYWKYGFTHFCRFANLVYLFTEGKIDMYDDPKVRRLALFQQNCMMNPHESISFSDCTTDFTPSVWLSHLLKTKYPEVEIPSLAAPRSTAPELFALAATRPELASCEMRPSSYVFDSCEWFIYRKRDLTLAAKAGSNKEMHNHNDVGSFLISKGGRVTFTDLGGGEYTKYYFSNTRYELLNCSSRGHSVPIVNGEYQVVSDRKSTLLKCTEGDYHFTMEGAYAIPTLISLKRHFKASDTTITLTDSFEFTKSPTSIVERFVTETEPLVEEGRVKVGNTTLSYDPSVLSLSVSTDSFMRAGHVKTTAYLIDLTVKDPDTVTEVSVTFS